MFNVVVEVPDPREGEDWIAVDMFDVEAVPRIGESVWIWPVGTGFAEGLMQAGLVDKLNVDVQGIISEVEWVWAEGELSVHVRMQSPKIT